MYQNQLKEQKQAERMILFNAKVTAMFASWS